MNKPFLKWLGGKTRLIKEINEMLPEGKRLVEPFVGSGSVFLNTNYNEYLLSDSNEDLINLFTELCLKGRKFIENSKSYFIESNNQKDRYFEIRDKFNKTKDPSLMVYLNRHCFNGLWRYNSKGQFNTPFGKYDNPVHFPYKEMLFFIEKARKVRFLHLDFRNCFQNIKDGDVVYCDPPYAPLSITSNFSSYDSEGFSNKDQEDLVDISIKSSVPVLISNHNTEYTKQLYNKASYIKQIYVGRFVGGNRKEVGELLALFNYDYKPQTLWNNL